MARFQCVLHSHWSNEAYEKYLDFEKLSGTKKIIGSDFNSIQAGVSSGLNEIANSLITLAELL
jgi:hypothetical protein